MVRIVLAAVAVVVLLLVGGALFLGAFPPEPQKQEINRTLPNDRFPAK
jgi:hypothetical protein